MPTRFCVTMSGVRTSAVAAGLMLLLFVACGDDEGSEQSATLGTVEVPGAVTGGAPPGEDVGDLPEGRAIIVTGVVSVRVDDVRQAADAVRQQVGTVGGYLAASDIALDSDRPSAYLTFRVPTERYDEAVAAAGAVGTLLSQRANTEDVTAQVVDLEARGTALDISIERLNTFLAKVENVEDLARLEAELTDRETALEQLRAQQRGLDDQVSYATLEVQLTTSGVPAGSADDDRGFSFGFDRGVDAVRGLATAATTVIGFSLPFAPVAVAAVLLLIAARRILRRRTRVVEPTPATPPDGSVGDPPAAVDGRPDVDGSPA